MFRFESSVDNGGFSFIGRFSEIIEEIRTEYGSALVAKVRTWCNSNSEVFQSKSFTIYRL